MAQITCPHCQNTVQLNLSAAADEFVCPICGGSIVSPTAPPARQSPVAPQQPPVAADAAPMEVPAPTEVIAPMEVIAVESLTPPPLVEPTPPPEVELPERQQPEIVARVPVGAPVAAVASQSETQDWNQRALRHYSSEERSSRRFIKNVIIWTVCAILMVLLVLFFLTR